MRQSVAYRDLLRDSIKSEITERTLRHQSKVAALKSAEAARPHAFAEAADVDPLILLAHGDSWFDYPLVGNGPLPGDTDVVAQLQRMGTPNPLVLNVSHHGDATSDELSWPKQQRLITALADPSNWRTGKPDAILFSGGGDDIAGDQFCIFIDYADSQGAGLDARRFQGVLDSVRASYLDLFLFRDRNANGVPVLAHCYDFATPNGVHPVCAGPWLQPSLNFTGWNLAQGTLIVRDALAAFRLMLLDLANNPSNNFTLVDTQGTLTATQWANELHPVPTGFQLIAGKFVNALRTLFPRRI